MRVLSYGGVLFATINGGTTANPSLSANFPDDVNGPDVQPVFERVIGGDPRYIGLERGTKSIPVVFLVRPGYNIEQTFHALLAALDLTDDRERVLAGQLNDTTAVEIMASVGPFVFDRVNSVLLTFSATDPIWRVPEADATQDVHTTTGVADLGMPLDVQGQAPLFPIIRLKPTAVRTLSSASIGWRFRHTIVVTNNTPRTFHRKARRLALGNTSTWVGAGEAQADGDDVLILDPRGRVVPRTLVTFNTAASYAWILLDDLDPGEARTYAVVYGNPSAVSPQTLSYPDKPANDITSSTNTLLAFAVNPVASSQGLGGWYIDQATMQPGIADRSVPNAWRASGALFENEDDFAVAPWRSYVDGSTYYGAFMQIKRGRANALGLLDKGLADMVEFYDPQGITSLAMDYYYNNPAHAGIAVTKMRKLCRRSGALDWTVVGEDSAVRSAYTSSIITDTFTAPYPTHVAVALLPYNEDRIPEEAAASAFGELRWATTLQIGLDSGGLTVGAISAKETIYDLAGQLYLNAFQEPFQQMALGGFSSATQGRLMVPLNNSIIIDCEARTVQEWDGTLIAKVRDVADGAVVLDVETIDGVVTEFLAKDWFRFLPRAEQQGNMGFGANIDGWNNEFTGAGVTFVESWDGVVFGSDGPGSMKGVISPNTAGAAQTLATMVNTTYYAVTPGNKDRFTMEVRSSSANLRPYLAISYYTAALAPIITYSEGAWTVPVNTWVRRVFEATAPATAAFARVVAGWHGVTASITGTAWFDRGRFNKNDLTWAAYPWDGTLEVTLSNRKGWY